MSGLGLPSDRPTTTCSALAEQAADLGEGRILAVGAVETCSALFARHLFRRRAAPTVFITPTLERARELHDDLSLLAPSSAPRLLFDPGEQRPYADRISNQRAAGRRLAALYQLASLSADTPLTIVLPASALVHKVVPASQVMALAQHLTVGDEIDRDELLATLSGSGYARCPLVEDPATMSVRGALLDVWSPSAAAPLRIDFDGDTIASLKTFVPSDQRTAKSLNTAELIPAREAFISPQDSSFSRSREGISERIRARCDAVNWPSSKTRKLIEDLLHARAFLGAEGFLPAFRNLAPLHEQLPDNALFVLEDPRSIFDALGRAYSVAQRDQQSKAAEPHFPLESFLTSPSMVDTWLGARPAVALCGLAISGGDAHLERMASASQATPSLASQPQQELARAIASARNNDGSAGGIDILLERIASWQAEGLRVILTARTTTQAERLVSLLSHREVAVALETETAKLEKLLQPARNASEQAQLNVVVGNLSRGLTAPTEGLVLVTEEEVFGPRAKPRSASKRKPSAQRLLEDLRSLRVGDHVVHTSHGVGRYEGLIHREVAGRTVDLLVVSYSGGDKLYLPVYRLNQIHRYRGGDGPTKLDRLGGQSFSKTKSRAKKRAKEMADQLLALYAERRNASGEATPPIDDEYRAFEAGFPYQETDDQARAISEVSADLESTSPMDRLVCGDVGFGKTEVALRAAFRVAMAGRQVAVLCPTTILAQQHKLTFSKRLASYPLSVSVLSRFSTKRAIDTTIAGLRDGTVDVVVGTHRLLSKDVHFKNLGLLIVDEEQRFGVAAKERITQLKANVDVLTLTATPIPRTLQMAVGGMRDLSLIHSPPTGRRSVRTIVTHHTSQNLQEAIERELRRSGQLFYVYNRVEGLAERAALVSQLAPDATVAIVHGQMPERLLERTMLSFIAGDIDILCTTAIIENGLDIPRCNTIIIDRADLMGLSQLYQLRGRVGRSSQRGYCYLLLPPGQALSPEGRARIEALQRYSELGSGFQVASLDLDQRGSGNLLGAEQSGSVASVGFEMFCSLLAQAADELRGVASVAEVDPELSFDVEALLPENYMPDVGVRLSLYKRFAGALSSPEIDDLAAEMEDRFGRPPEEARRLVRLMRVKAEARRLRALACEASATSVTLHLRDDTPLDPHKLTQALRTHRLPYRLTPDMRLTRRSEPGENFPSGLEAAERLIAELQRFVKAADAP